MNSIADIKHAYYINLASRTDRKEHVEKQLKKIGLEAERFNAIKLPNGALGCSMSHLKCLENAKENGYTHVLIVEDDILFLDPKLFIQQLNAFFKNHKLWDVVIFGGNNVPPYQTVDNTCIKVGSCQTTTGYLVNGHYLPKLIENYRNGINNLLKYPHLPTLYAIDKYWFHLQKRDNWYLIVPLTVVQREDYSDIEKKQTNYTKMMTDIDKEQLFVRQKIVQNNFPSVNTVSGKNISLKSSLPNSVMSAKKSIKMQI